MILMPMPEDRYIKVGNINTRYWTSGEQGTPVVLIHGLGGSIENWVKNIDVLGQSHRVYSLDLKGFGRTDKTPLLRDMDELTKFIGDFMAALNIDKASLIGNSLGGGLALSFALQHPDKVEKLVLVDNAGMGPEVIADFRVISLPVIGELLYHPNRKAVAGLWGKIVFDASLVTDELVEQTYKLAVLPGAVKSMLSTLRAGIGISGQSKSQRMRVTDKISALKAPTLIFWGKQDRIIPAAHAEIALRMMPDATLHLLDNCGHMPQLEHPEEFNKLVLDFLA